MKTLRVVSVVVSAGLIAVSYFGTLAWRSGLPFGVLLIISVSLVALWMALWIGSILGRKKSSESESKVPKAVTSALLRSQSGVAIGKMAEAVRFNRSIRAKERR
jgi:hypothetical protein